MAMNLPANSIICGSLRSRLNFILKIVLDLCREYVIMSNMETNRQLNSIIIALGQTSVVDWFPFGGYFSFKVR